MNSKKLLGEVFVEKQRRPRRLLLPKKSALYGSVRYAEGKRKKNQSQ
jgi:hypothetical protein